jgi:hypothetical protein
MDCMHFKLGFSRRTRKRYLLTWHRVCSLTSMLYLIQMFPTRSVQVQDYQWSLTFLLALHRCVCRSEDKSFCDWIPVNQRRGWSLVFQFNEWNRKVVSTSWEGIFTHRLMCWIITRDVIYSSIANAKITWSVREEGMCSWRDLLRSGSDFVVQNWVLNQN